MMNRLRAWIDRFEQKRKRRKYLRRWAHIQPGEQMAILIKMLEDSPEMRRAFRVALFGKQNEAVSHKRR